MERKYYVYCYYDKHQIPFYIGMGSGNRITNHLKLRSRNTEMSKSFFYRTLNKMVKNNEPFSFKILKNNLTQSEAFIAEQVLISCIGRKNLGLGTLTNLTDGGRGGVGYRRTKKRDGKKIAIYDRTKLTLIKVFDRVSDCAEFLNVKRASVVTAETDHYTTGNPTKYYVLRFNNSPLLKYPHKREPQANPVLVKNKITNEILKFKSVKECARYFQIDKTTVINRIENDIKVRVRKPFLNNLEFSYDK